MEVHTIHFDTINSTNTWGKTNAHTLDPKKMTCIFAAIQTAGHGTYAKQWISQRGNLHMSLFFRLPPHQPLPAYMAQLFAYSSAQVLRKENIPVRLKWPNDLLVDGKKLSGVLVETVQLGTQLGVVIGIGMNVNAPIQADQPTTSLIELTGRSWNLTDLADQIIHQFQKDQLLDSNAFHEEFDKLLIGKRP